MTDCPPKLRGDLSKWLCEINTGVYVGNLSARVRDAVWRRVCESLKNGRATMVFTTNNEQGMDFRVHHAAWEPVDLDGIHLMRRPKTKTTQNEELLQPGFSHAAKRHMQEKKKRAAQRQQENHTIIDFETTGLDPAHEDIIEMGALRVRNGEAAETFSQLVLSERALPTSITELTGIDEALLAQEGRPLKDVLTDFLSFIGQDTLVGYHLSFDMNFLQEACRRCALPPPVNRCMDVLNQARRKIFGVPNHQLRTIAQHFDLDIPGKHRALDDCILVHQIRQKLNEK